jgi:hypothetical protein
MKITETEDEIILRDTPLGFWIMGIFGIFLFGGCFIWMIVYTIFNPREIFKADGGGWLGSVFAVVMYVLFLAVIGALAAAFIGFILSSVTTTTINRKSRFVEISRRNLLRKKVKRYEFSQIKRFDTESRTAGRLGLKYFVALLLKNNRKIEIEEKGFSNSDAEGMIEKLNNFAGFSVVKKSAKMKTQTK